MADEQSMPSKSSDQDFSAWLTVMTSLPAGISWLDGSRVASDVNNIT